MDLGFPLFPEQASTMAPRVDALLYFLIAVSGFFVALISLAILVFAVKYRRRAEDERPEPIEGNLWLEVVWSVIPFGLTVVMFVWGAIIFLDIYNPPNDALEIGIVGRQWMWKAQHPTGKAR